MKYQFRNILLALIGTCLWTGMIAPRHDEERQYLSTDCNTLTLINGRVLLVRVSKVNALEIKYKKCGKDTGPYYYLNKTDISKANYANGLQVTYENGIPTDPNQAEFKDQDRPKVSHEAVLAFLLSLLGFILFLIGFWGVGILMLLIGLIWALVSLRKIKRSKGKLKGKGFVIASISIGILFILFSGALSLVLGSI